MWELDHVLIESFESLFDVIVCFQRNIMLVIIRVVVNKKMPIKNDADQLSFYVYSPSLREGTNHHYLIIIQSLN